MITGKPMHASNPLDKGRFGNMSRTVRLRIRGRGSATDLAAQINYSLVGGGFDGAVTIGGEK
jgi:hypothetical protein